MKTLRFVLIFLVLAAVAVYYFFFAPSQKDRVLAPTSDTPITKVDKPLAETAVSFIFAGDLMLDRDVYHQFKNLGLSTIFSNLPADLFSAKNISVLNLEGPISETAISDDTTVDNLVFNFPPESGKVLKDLGVGFVSLANNHTNNAGDSGFKSTKKMLDQSNIKYFGQPFGYSTASSIRVESEEPITIFAVDALATFDSSKMNTDIAAAKSRSDYVIIFPHWGTEYAAKHSSSQKNLATGWIDAGADLIIGSHPHVVEDFEMVNGKPVFYSLGNFVFDQYFSTATQQGLIISGKLYKDKVQLSFLPTKEVKIKPILVSDIEKTNRIKEIFDINSQVGFTKISDDTIEIAR